MKNQFKCAVLCLFTCVVNLSEAYTRKVSITYNDNDISLHKDGGSSLENEVASLYLGSSFDDGDDAGPNLYEDVRLSLHKEEISFKDKSKDYGKPLFLTPYIERGDIKGAQQAALVEPFYDNIISYSGFLTVNKQYNSNMYFWFFPAEINSETAPVVLWLQGGPGSSSMIGLFEQHGPFYLTKNFKIKPRKYYWTKTMNVIYIDNPIGAGFSFTRNVQGYSTNENDIGENLYNAVTQFFQLFPKFIQNDFYLAGQSYGGKYAPPLAYVIDKSNMHLRNSAKKINLKGISIGNGFCDPINMVNFSDYLYPIGLIDWRTKLEFEESQGKLINSIKEEKYLEAHKLLTNMLQEFEQKCGFKYFENYLFSKKPTLYGNLRQFFVNPKIRKNMHVGNCTYHDASLVEEYLMPDFFKSIKPRIEAVIEKYKVLLYNGQLDLYIPYPSTLKFIRSLNWSGTEVYKSAERKLWYVDDELAGYTKTAKNFTEVLMRNAGHITESDQPKWTIDLIQKFTHNSL